VPLKEFPGSESALFRGASGLWIGYPTVQKEPETITRNAAINGLNYFKCYH